MHEPRSDLPPAVRRAVVLRHEPASAIPGPHFDLLLEPAHDAPEETRDVPTFRCPRRPDLLAIGEETSLEPIAPHRRWWLGRPSGEVVDLTPPRGRARSVAVGPLITRPSASECDSERFAIRWSADSPWAEFRIEGSRLIRLAPGPEHLPAAGSGGSCCCGAGPCC